MEDTVLRGHQIGFCIAIEKPIFRALLVAVSVLKKLQGKYFA